MTLKTMLLPWEGEPANAAVLDVALALGRRFDVHIEALHVRNAPIDSTPFVFDRLSPRLKASVLQESAHAIEARAAAARELFEGCCAERGVPLSDDLRHRKGVSARWREVEGRTVDELVRYARMADLAAVELPGPKRDHVRRSPAGENLEALLLGTGRPVLIAPPLQASSAGRRIAIGWNDSAESTRALSVCLALLRDAERVDLCVSQRRMDSATRMVEYLGWHDVSAGIQVLELHGVTVARALLNSAKHAGADLLVVGGYSRSRTKQLLFGGVTRRLLYAADLPVIMVH